MIYFTSLSDTPNSIAKDLLGGIDYGNVLGDSIRDANRNTMASRCGIGSYYAPNRPIWIPGFSSIGEYGPIRDAIIRRLDTLHSEPRSRLATAIRRRNDLNPIMGATHAIEKNNRANSDKAKVITASLAGAASIETAKRTIERVNHQAEKFSESMAKLNDVTKQAAEIHKLHGPSSDAFKAIRATLQEQHQETVQVLNKHAKLFARRLSIKTTKHMRSAKIELMRARKKGIMISDLDDVKRIEKIARYGKWASHSLFAFSIALGIDEVYETYQNGGDAFVKATGLTFEMTSSAVLGGLVTFAFTPAGWVALAGFAVVEGVAFAFAGKGLESAGEKLGKGLEECYEWVKEKLKNLL